MRYIILGRPPGLVADFSHVFIRISAELAGKGRLHTTDDGIVPLVRQLTPPPPPDSQRPVGRAAWLLNDEPVRIYVPLHMRPWVMQACQSTAPRHHAHSTDARTFLLLD